MTILEVTQGHIRDLAGLTLSQARARLEAWDADYLEKFPQFKATHRPSWVELEVSPRCTAPFGREWYALNDQGRLFLHSTDIDSSG